MSKLHANLWLVLAAFIWGMGNIAHKTVLDHLDPVAVVGLACLIGGIVILPMLYGERGHANAPGWWASLARLTALFAVSVVLQQIAYVGASVTNASFLISTYTVMTPLAAWLMLRERPSARIVLAAMMTVAGFFLMSGGLSGVVTLADLISLLTAASFAFWTVELSRHMRQYGRPFATAATQFLTTAAIILPFSALSGDLTLSGIVEGWPELVVLGVFSTAIAYAIQTVAQRHTSAGNTAIITSSEAVFAAIAAGVLLDERLGAAGLSGACLVSSAVLLVAGVGDGASRTRPARVA